MSAFEGAIPAMSSFHKVHEANAARKPPGSLCKMPDDRLRYAIR